MKTIEESIKYIKNKKGFSYFFAGQHYFSTEQWFMNNDCLRLLSFVNDKRLIEKRCKNNCFTFVDSGAFSAMNRQLSINVDEYIDWLNKYEQNLLMYCQWDYIPLNGNEAELCAEKTWDNYLYMQNKLKNPDKLVYCYHYGEDIKWLKQALNNDIKVIAIGGIAKRHKKTKYEFLEQVEKTIKQSKKDVAIHLFGVSSLDILNRFTFVTSSDSSSWLYPAKFGFIDTNCLGSVYFGEKENKKNNYYELSLHNQADVDIELNNFGFKPKDMQQSKLRSIYQANFYKYRMENVNN